eukprot:scaffold677898_cov64-Prasinocladus_malaysianus.AAC.1
MVFEALGENLLSLIKRFHYRGLPVPLVRRLAKDVLVGLDYLHRYARCIIINHTRAPEGQWLVARDIQA